MGIPGRIGTTRPFAEIARGTTTSVYKAYDEDADGIVAVKLLHQRWLADADLASRFLAEADALRSVTDEHVVSIRQSGECEAGLFIVTEFVEGSTLEALLRQRTVPSAFALLAIRDAAAGLAAAHKEGIVHRDFKPANIIVGDSGVVKLADFGLSGFKPRGSASDSESGADSAADAGAGAGAGAGTQPPVVVGTPGYLAPEVVAGYPANVASDVFSVGVSLFEALAGGLSAERSRGMKSATFQLARAGDALLAALEKDERELIGVLTSALPEERPRDAAAVRPLIDELMARFQPVPTTNLFADWLGQIGPGTKVRAPRRAGHAAVAAARKTSPAPAAAATTASGAAQASDRTSIETQSHAWWSAGGRAGAAAALLLALAVVTILVWRISRTEAPGGEASTMLATESPTDSPGTASEPPADSPAELAATPTTESTEGAVASSNPTSTPTQVILPPPPATLPDDRRRAERETQNDLAASVTSQPGDTVNRADISATSASNGGPTTAQQAFLAVAASPWAEVLVDGVTFGTTPIGQPVAVEPGEHEVVLRHPDFPDYVGRIDALPDDTVSLSVSMWSTVARLNLTVSPWAVVMINDAVRDTTPIRSDLIVRPGPTDLTLLHPTLGSWSTALDLKADSTYMMRFNLFELTRR